MLLHSYPRSCALLRPALYFIMYALLYAPYLLYAGGPGAIVSQSENVTVRYCCLPPQQVDGAFLRRCGISVWCPQQSLTQDAASSHYSYLSPLRP